MLNSSSLLCHRFIHVAMCHSALHKHAEPTPTQKPGFKPLTDGTKGAYVGGASAVCGAALQSGDFYLGLACAFLLVVGGIVINRPKK